MCQEHQFQIPSGIQRKNRLHFPMKSCLNISHEVYCSADLTIKFSKFFFFTTTSISKDCWELHACHVLLLILAQWDWLPDLMPNLSHKNFIIHNTITH